MLSFEDVIDPDLDAVRLMSWERIVELLDGAGAFLAHRAKVEEGDDIKGVVDFIDADVRRFVCHGLEIFVVSLSRQKEGDEEDNHGCGGQDEKSHPENEWPI